MAITRAYGVPLSKLSTFRIGGAAREVATVETEADLAELFAGMKEGDKWFVLGGGSNVVFPDGECDAVFIRFAPKGMRIEETDAGILVTAGAGVGWDEFVAYTVGQELSGIEALSAIPGTVGATPIQNVGAYGTEVSRTIASLRAFDVQTNHVVSFANAECAFAYRDSMFKHEGKGRYIITEVTFKLSKAAPIVPDYPGVADYFARRGIAAPGLAQIREAITAIRASKLPDPKDIASVGSFFKNPIVKKETADALKAAHPKLAVFSVNETLSKVGAGSLIDCLGWKGKSFGPISIYENNALVLVNTGGATRSDLAHAVSQIVAAVHEKYDVMLEAEPELIGNF